MQTDVKKKTLTEEEKNIKVQKKLNFTFNYKTKQELLKETNEYIALMRDLEYYVFY